jgi:hypothetical protein
VILLLTPDKVAIDVATAWFNTALADSSNGSSPRELVSTLIRQDSNVDSQLTEAIETHQPTVVVVTSRKPNITALSIAYRVTWKGGEYFPDLLFEHNATPVALSDTEGTDPYLPVHVEPPLAALAAFALDRLAPHRVVAALFPVNGSAGSVGPAIGALMNAAFAAHEVETGVCRMREGRRAAELETWMTDATEQLRLTFSQRARLAAAARAACARDADLPSLPARQVESKLQNRVALYELESDLNGRNRTTV